MALENRNAKGNDIVSGASTKAVVFTNAFYSSPSIGVAAQNMATGDYFTISSKSATGFSIDFRNSGGTHVNRTFDYVAEGYGLTP